MIRTIVIAAGIATAAVGAYVGYAKLRRGSPAATAVEPEAKAENAPAGAHSSADPVELARLRHEVAFLRLEMAANRERAAREAEPHGSQPRAPEQPDKPSPREIAAATASWRAHMEEVAASFHKEPFDARWAAGMTSAVKDAASKHAAVNRMLQKIECRSQTCRVEITYDNSNDLAEQIPFFLQDTGRDLPTMQSDHVDVAGGAKTMVLYLTKGKTGT